MDFNCLTDRLELLLVVSIDLKGYFYRSSIKYMPKGPASGWGLVKNHKNQYKWPKLGL